MVYIKKADRIAETQSVVETRPEVIAPPKIKVKRDWSNKDKLKVSDELKKKYANMEFAWVLRNADKMEEYEGNGWEYAHLEKSERKTERPGGQETTFVTKGDLVLMILPKEDYSDMHAQRTSEVQERMRVMSGTAGLRKEARNVHDSAVMKERIDTELKDSL